MADQIKMPSVGESITSAEISQWLKADGDYVTADDEILMFETDKVSQGLPAGFSGILRHKVNEGDEVAIGAILAEIEKGEAPEATSLASDTKVDTKVDTKTESKSLGGNSGVRATPLAQKIADDKGVNLSNVEGTGIGGKITKNDVAVPQKATPERAVATPVSDGRTSRKKMSRLRQKIADHLVTAQQEAAILTTFNECDMTAIMELRKKVQESFVAKHGTKLGFMSFFIKAVVEGLKTVPSINGRIDGDEVIENHFYDIGVAVGTEKGLLVPVVRDCDKKSYSEIEQAIVGYANKARDGKIQLTDLQGGVFTISNGGIYGSLLSTPILNPPQSGILGMHTIQQRPIALDGEVVIRPMMYLALSYDHRLVDGKEAVTFLIRLKDYLENPDLSLIDI